jgi:hypothetical protein
MSSTTPVLLHTASLFNRFNMNRDISLKTGDIHLRDLFADQLLDTAKMFHLFVADQ